MTLYRTYKIRKYKKKTITKSKSNRKLIKTRRNILLQESPSLSPKHEISKKQDFRFVSQLLSLTRLFVFSWKRIKNVDTKFVNHRFDGIRNQISFENSLKSRVQLNLGTHYTTWEIKWNSQKSIEELVKQEKVWF